MKNSCSSSGVPRMNWIYTAATAPSGQMRDMRAMPVARPHTMARQNASSDTVIVSSAPCSSDGRNWIMSSRENNGRSLIVVAGQTPFRENLLHLPVVLHPLHGGRKCRDPLDVRLTERIGAVAGGV